MSKNQKQALKTRLAEARGLKELAELERDTAIACEEARILTLTGSMVMEEGAYVDPHTPYIDTPGFSPMPGRGGRGMLHQVSPLDRVRGDFPPHFYSEMQWRMILAEVRHLADTDEMAISAMGILTDFAIHTGYSREVKPVKDGSVPSGLVDLCDEIIATADRESGICCKWERDRFYDRRRDGETLTGYERLSPGVWRLSMLPPDNLTEPSLSDASVLEKFWGFPECDWGYGVATGKRDKKVYGYFFQWGEQTDDWGFFPADMMMHSKLNVPANVRRGLSDLFAPKDRLRGASILATNTVVGSAMQAKIALIRKQAAKQGPASRLGTTTKLTRQDSEGNEKEYFIETPEGPIIVDTKDSVNYESGPLGHNNAAGYIDVGKDSVRIGMRRWSMPAWMSTGDGDLVNHASSLTTEAPFTRSNQGRQRDEADDRREMYWKILDAESQPGGVIFDRYRDFAGDLRAYVEIKVEPPDTSAHDTLKDSQENEVLHRNDVISTQTWRERAGVDHETEVERIAKQREDEADSLKAATATVNKNLKNAAEESWSGYCGGTPLSEHFGPEDHASGSPQSSHGKKKDQEKKQSDDAPAAIRQLKKGGFTFSPKTGEFPTGGFVVSAFPEAEMVIPDDVSDEELKKRIESFFEQNYSLFVEDDRIHYGGWHDAEDTHTYQLDLVILVEDKADAIAIGKEFNQQAIFDLGKGETIQVDSDGAKRRRELGEARHVAAS